MDTVATEGIDPLDVMISAILRGMQAEQKITNIAFAAQSQIHPRTLIRILTGTRAPTTGELRRLAQVLGVTASSIAMAAERRIQGD